MQTFVPPAGNEPAALASQRRVGARPPRLGGPYLRFYFLVNNKLKCCSLQLKMWISFMIPKIEDGNNFGVSIQEDTLAEIQSVESEAAAFFDQISRYFISRAKIVSKVAKYPHIDDYRRAVRVSIPS